MLYFVLNFRHDLCVVSKIWFVFMGYLLLHMHWLFIAWLVLFCYVILFAGNIIILGDKMILIIFINIPCSFLKYLSCSLSFLTILIFLLSIL